MDVVQIQAGDFRFLLDRPVCRLGDNRGLRTLLRRSHKIFHVSAVVLAFSTTATTPAEKAIQVTVLRASNPVVVAPPGSKINVEANFNAQWALPQDDSLVLSLVGAGGVEAVRTENNLNNFFTVLPTSRWIGPITILSSMTVPKLSHGVYSIMVALYRPTGPALIDPRSQAWLRIHITAIRSEPFA